MEEYLLDTNICVFFLRGKLNLAEAIREKKSENFYISEITVLELRFGAENSDNPIKAHKVLDNFLNGLTIIPIHSCINRYAKEKVRLRKLGMPINDEFDLLIGVTSVEHKLILVTDNTKHFKNIDGIKMENWYTRKKRNRIKNISKLLMQTNISVPKTITIHPSKISGNIVAPASKSSMQRACAAALVKKGISIIHNPGVSNDDIASLNVIKTLGAKVEQLEDGSLKIDSTNILLDNNITTNFGESGLGIRMFTPIAALNNSTINIQGEGSLTSRPMDFFDEILPQLNVHIKSNNGKLPLQIKGPLQPKNITIDGSLSSQFLTGLLLAFSASINPSEGGTLKDDVNDNIIISVNNLKSRPYIDLTLKVMQDFGLNAPVNNNYEEFIFHRSQLPPLEGGEAYTVEGDWSGGAFLLVAGAIAGGINVSGLYIDSTQADKKILEALKDCGAQLSIQENLIFISPPSGGGGAAFHFDANDCPDLFPPLVALAAYCDGTTVIEGVERLTHKESNRALTLQEEFAKLGIEIILQGNTMLVKGATSVHSTIVHSRHDHRIAMACAVAALKADGNVTIEEADAVKKSYPNFYNHLEQLGVTLVSK